jgi:hypothetical protein
MARKVKSLETAAVPETTEKKVDRIFLTAFQVRVKLNIIVKKHI